MASLVALAILVEKQYPELAKLLLELFFNFVQVTFDLECVCSMIVLTNCDLV